MSDNEPSPRPMWKKLLPILGVLLIGWIALNLFSDTAGVDTRGPEASWGGDGRHRGGGSPSDMRARLREVEARVIRLERALTLCVAGGPACARMVGVDPQGPGLAPDAMP